MSDQAQSLILILVIVNFIPAIIASMRRHNNAVAIFVAVVVLDLFTLFLPVVAMIGWFIFLIWSLGANTRGREQGIAKMQAEYMVRSQQEQQYAPPQASPGTIVGTLRDGFREV